MWAIKRRLIIVFSLVLFIILVIGSVYYISRSLDNPLCTDGKQNGTETGIDCGGNCAKVCQADIRPLAISWARVVPVTDRVYSVAIEVENKNYNAVASDAVYSCNIQTADFRIVQTVKKTISVPPAGAYTFVVPSIKFTSSDIKPDRVSCAIRDGHEWFKLPDKITPNPFDIQNIKLNADERPDGSALIINTDRFRTYQNFKVSAVVYDSTQTVIAASETTVDRLTPGSKSEIVFTWPVAFKGIGPYRMELSPVFEFPDFQ